MTRGVAILVALASVSSGAIVRAHGRPPSLQSVTVDPTDPQHLVAQATWGLASSRDGGATWQWTCAAAFDVDARMEDPLVTFDADGALRMASFGGLLTSEDGCAFSTDDPGFGGYPFTLARASDGSVYTSINVSFEPDELWRRDPSGVWESLGLVGADDDLIDSLVTAPSDAARIYIAGGSSSRDDMGRRRLTVRASGDRGRTFRSIRIEPRGEEYSVHVLAVDPRDPDRVWAVTRTFDGEAAAERVMRSVDGGETFTVQLELPQLRGLLVRGDEVWVGSALGGLHLSEDRGETFREVSAAPIRCLADVGGVVTACGDPSAEDERFRFALARWEDDALVPTLALDRIVRMRSCPTCSDVGIVCPAWLPDLVLDLGLDPEEAGYTGALPNPDGGTGGPRDAGLPFECGGPPPPSPDCGCMAPGASGGRNATSPAGAGLVIAGLVWRQRRRRKKRSAAPSKSALP